MIPPGRRRRPPPGPRPPAIPPERQGLPAAARQHIGWPEGRELLGGTGQLVVELSRRLSAHGVSWEQGHRAEVSSGAIGTSAFDYHVELPLAGFGVPVEALLVVERGARGRLIKTPYRDWCVQLGLTVSCPRCHRNLTLDAAAPCGTPAGAPPGPRRKRPPPARPSSPEVEAALRALGAPTGPLPPIGSGEFVLCRGSRLILPIELTQARLLAFLVREHRDELGEAGCDARRADPASLWRALHEVDPGGDVLHAASRDVLWFVRRFGASSCEPGALVAGSSSYQATAFWRGDGLGLAVGSLTDGCVTFHNVVVIARKRLGYARLAALLDLPLAGDEAKRLHAHGTGLVGSFPERPRWVPSQAPRLGYHADGQDTINRLGLVQAGPSCHLDEGGDPRPPTFRRRDKPKSGR